MWRLWLFICVSPCRAHQINRAFSWSAQRKWAMCYSGGLKWAQKRAPKTRGPSSCQIWLVLELGARADREATTERIIDPHETVEILLPLAIKEICDRESEAVLICCVEED